MAVRQAQEIYKLQYGTYTTVTGEPFGLERNVWKIHVCSHRSGCNDVQRVCDG